MSNFLQRVAAAAIQPPARLHPILGSHFASTAVGSSKDFFSAGAEIALQTLAPHPNEPIATSTFGASDQTRRADPSSAPPDQGLSSAHAPRIFNADPPLLPAFDPRHQAGTTTQAHSFSAMAEGAEAIDVNPSTHQAEITVVPQPAPKKSPYQTLLAPTQQPAPRLHPHEPVAASAMRASRAEAARRSQPAQHEPDEVHIHIGRIEVAAVPQQAARPAAASARRSINLSDYLARNGRSG